METVTEIVSSDNRSPLLQMLHPEHSSSQRAEANTMNMLPFLFIDLFQVSEFCLIESDDPVVDNYPGVVPPVAAVKEEDQRPFADPVQEFLSRHIRIQLTLEKQEVGVERDVDDGFAGSIVRDYQPRRGGSCKPGGGEFVESCRDRSLAIFLRPDHFLSADPWEIGDLSGRNRIIVKVQSAVVVHDTDIELVSLDLLPVQLLKYETDVVGVFLEIYGVLDKIILAKFHGSGSVEQRMKGLVGDLPVTFEDNPAVLCRFRRTALELRRDE